MALSTDQDYEHYLERFAATKASGTALSRSDFYRYSDRLDELHLVDIECGLTSDEQRQLEGLTALLLEAPVEGEPPVPIIDIGDVVERRRDPEDGQDTPVLFRRQFRHPQREVWRMRRFRR